MGTGMETPQVEQSIPGSFGAWVQQRRDMLGFTRNELASHVGCSPVTIKKIERDERRPSRQLAVLLAEHLKIDPAHKDRFIRRARGEFVPDTIVPTTESIIEEGGGGLVPNNLPQSISPFIGREAAVGQLIDLINDPTKRLVSIIGAGGMGKTRLALEVSTRLLDDNRFINGIYLINFSSHSDATHIVPAIAEGLGFSIRRESRSPKKQLIDYLSNKQILLLFDNFEHMLEGVDIVLEILNGGPELKLLVTTRERLYLQEEQVYPIDGLTFPKSIEQLDGTQYESIDLFLDAARRIRPDFRLNQDNLNAVAEICSLVEGMPLAIEMAGAWIDMLSPPEIADEIKHGLDILTTEVRNFPPRHRSIRAVFDASWERLSDSEKSIFPQLTIFRGGGSRKAIRAITGASLADLGRLVDRYFVRYNQARETYHIHELLRQYGLEVLTKTEVSDLYQRHAEYYLSAVAERYAHLKGKGQAVALLDIEDDIQNVREAWNWAVSQSRFDLVKQAIDSFCTFLEMQGHYTEGRKKMSRLVSELGSLPNSETRHLKVLALVWQSAYELALGDQNQARTHLEVAGTLLETLMLEPDTYKQAKAFVLHYLGHLYSISDLAGALPLYEQALSIYKELDEAWETASLSAALGYASRALGRYDEARDYLQASLQLRTSFGDHIGSVSALAGLSELALYKGQYFEAKELAKSCVDLARQIQNQSASAQGLAAVGIACFHLGEFHQQHIYLIECVALNEELGNRYRLADAYYKLSMANNALGNYQDAMANARRGLSLARQASIYHEAAMLLYSLGISMLAEGHLDSAKQHLEESLSTFQGAGREVDINLVLAMLGWAEYINGNPTIAKRHLFTALQTGHQLQDTISTVPTLGIIARIFSDQNEHISAVTIWEVIKRQTGSFLNADFLQLFFGQQLTQTANMLSDQKRQGIEEEVHKNNLWDICRSLLETLEAENWLKK